eukprot:TRINITY_DN9834_c0_g1_i1.p1 TRINITY_DN9834_c0_g1~~TRINITY_DN9834_c0_g1_i1.p1  ORF type:complete len:157 (+),score=56.06 TRINITY_DN9834_c0_g1_i1:20-490(+)
MATKDDRYYEDTNKIRANPQGGKAFGQTQKQRENELRRIADEYRAGNTEATEADTEKLITKFMLYDLDGDLVINIEELRLMMEKLGQPKTHLELKKMIEQVDTTGKGHINFHDFLTMMLGKSSNSILKKILMFEELAKEKETPKGLPPKKSIKDLP